MVSVPDLAIICKECFYVLNQIKLFSNYDFDIEQCDSYLLYTKL